MTADFPVVHDNADWSLDPQHMSQFLRMSINTRTRPFDTLLPSSEFPLAHTELRHAQLAFIWKFLFCHVLSLKQPQYRKHAGTCNVPTDLSLEKKKLCTEHLGVHMVPRINREYLSIFIAWGFLLYDQNILRIDASALISSCLIARWNR
jgi:hypothetical protein